jgi:hypothetical protein
MVNVYRPQSVAEVRSFLGLVKYYYKFQPYLSTILLPLNQMLEVTTNGTRQINAKKPFAKLKE